MIYADYSAYKTLYFGDEIPPKDGLKWLSRASDTLDLLTHGRLRSSYPSEYEDKIKKATCALADTLYQIDKQQKAVAAQQAEDGTFRGAVSSVTAGAQSISYSVSGTANSVFASAASDESARQKLIYDTVCVYLANVPDKNGVNLLYSGV